MSFVRATVHRPRSLFAPQGLRTSMLRMDGEEWLVMSFPLNASALPGELTKAERAVVGALLRGLSNSDIALERGTSVNTVSNQMASVFKKLGVQSRLDLVRSLGGAASATEGATDEP